MTEIAFTQITSDNCEMTKRYGRNEAGAIESSAIAHMTQGRARVMRLSDLTHIDGALRSLDPHQAITCGLPTVGDCLLTTRAGAEFRPDAVARTNEAFDWHYGASLFPIDVDVDSSAFRSVGEVLDALESCHPWLRHVTRVARPSSSSFVADRGLRGVHVYIAVTRGIDIPQLAKRMQTEQWLAGRGYIKISKSGALLVRQLSDDLVYQPSRLLFESQPVCEGVERLVPADQAVVIRAERPIGPPLRARTPEGLLDIAELPAIKAIDERRAATMIKQARDSRRSEAKRVAIDYQIANAIANGYDAKEGERYGLIATRALGDKLLPASWELFVKDIGRVKVADALANIEAALGHQCADPFDTWRPDLEPKHCTKAEIVRMGDRYGVWSHKQQQFFAFTDLVAADLASPLEQAAEKFCGVLEYPEKMGKTASLVNVKFALEKLLNETNALPRLNLATGYVDRTDCPPASALIDALSRVGCTNISKSAIDTALDAIGEINAHDPWKATILSLPAWDKTPRLDTIFQDVCSTIADKAHILTGRVLFAGIVMRQLHPGAGLPIVPVLIGRQGYGKSQFVLAIARALNMPAPSAITFTDARTMSMRAARSIIAELSEMSGMGKRDMDEIKSWTGDTTDAYRRPYDREEKEHLRRFVLVGTANQNELNRDVTGNRRFMPIDVNTPIKPEWSVEILQLLAEARDRFCQDERAYNALLREASDAVYEHNYQDMLQGVGVPEHTLDDLMPPIIRNALAASGARKAYTGDVRRALDAQASGKSINSREVAQWFRRSGWMKGQDNRGRYFEAPVGLELQAPTTVVAGPFAGVAA